MKYGNTQLIFLKVQLFEDKEVLTKLINSVALVRERIMPTERPPHVGEVSANFLRIEE
jgi:hypothetical protein